MADVIGPLDSLATRPERIIVAGTAGSGKTTLCESLSRIFEVEHIEIDALFHGPNWTPRECFEADVVKFSSRQTWVTEWQYSAVRDLLADRADLVVWLDLPRRTVMRQVVLRTVRRRLRRKVLWNGNIEPPLHRIFFDDEHIVRWAWSTHHKTGHRIRRLAQRCPHLQIVRLRSRGDADRWMAGLSEIER